MASIKSAMKTFLTLAPIVIPLLIASVVILKPGYIIYTDVTEGLDVSKLNERYTYTYNKDYGEVLAEKARIPLFFSIWTIYKTAGLGDEYFVKIKILFTLLITAISFALSIKILNNHIKELRIVPKHAMLLSASLGALIYLINPWSANRITHFLLFMSSATVPLFFSLFYDFLYSEKIKLQNILYLALISSIFTATPHSALFEALIVFCTLFVFIITKSKEKSVVFERIKYVPLLLALSLLFNLYWILPFLSTLSTPDRVESTSLVNLLARFANLNNSIRLMGYWLADPNGYFTTGSKVIQLLQKLGSYMVVLVFVLFSHKFIKNSLAKTLITLFLISLFLSTSSFLTLEFYKYIMFYSPIKSIGWLFREIDKFGLVLAYIFSLSLTYLSAVFLSNKRSKWLVAVLVVPMAFFYLSYFTKIFVENYSPQQVPKEFFNAEELLDKDASEFNVVWYPGVPEPKWLSTKENRFIFTNLLSDKEAFSTRSESFSVLDYVFDPNNISDLDVGKVLDSFGVKYIFLRRDSKDPTSNSNALQSSVKLKEQASLRLIQTNEYFEIYQNLRFSGLAKIYSQEVVTDLGLDFFKSESFKSLNTEDTMFTFTDYNTGFTSLEKAFDLKEGALDAKLNQYKERFIFPSDYTFETLDGKIGPWKMSTLEDINNAESRVFFRSFEVYNNQFDYGKGVVSAVSDLQILYPSKRKAKSIGELKFSDFPNVKVSGGAINYTSKEEDFEAEWNIVRSDVFPISGAKGLLVTLDSSIDPELVPHFKLTFYRNNEDRTGIIRFDNQNQSPYIERFIKVPEDSRFADFSIWTLPTPLNNYSYQITNFGIYDLTGNLAKPETKLKVKPNCSSDCRLLVRVLKSPNGGQITLGVDGKSFTIDTEGNTDRFDWIDVGSTDIKEGRIEISLINESGFNSVNALVFLNTTEYQNLLSEGFIAEEKPETTTPKADLTKTNPTSYTVKLTEAPNTRLVVGFSKPYNRNWLLQGKPPIRVNGLTNGWNLDTQETNLRIEFKPQRYFYLGSILSIASMMLSSIFFIRSSKRS